MVMASMSAIFGIYFLVKSPETMERIWYISPLTAADQVLGILAILLLLESTRRCLGMALAMTAVVALLYAGLGAYIPGVFGHPGFNVTQIVDYLVWSDQGIFGLPLGVSATFVALFVILGAILKAGITDVFRDIAIRSASKTVEPGEDRRHLLVINWNSQWKLCSKCLRGWNLHHPSHEVQRLRTSPGGWYRGYGILRRPDHAPSWGPGPLSWPNSRYHLH